MRRLLLLEPGDASDGRASLFVCPECGDLGCGAVTVRVDKGADTISWREFGYENSYERSVDLASFAAIGPFHFDIDAYEKELEPYLAA